MMTDKKYKLIPSDKKWLYRIKALRDFGDVKKGDIGGYVESEKNLSHKGDCWIYGNACAIEDAMVYENASVYEHVKAYGHARVYGNALLTGRCRVYEKAMVWGNAVIKNDVEVLGRASVGGNAEVSGCPVISGYARVTSVCTKTPIHITGLSWIITITDSHMQIGCKCFSIEEWMNFSKKEIESIHPSAGEIRKEYKRILSPILKKRIRDISQYKSCLTKEEDIK